MLSKQHYTDCLGFIKQHKYISYACKRAYSYLTFLPTKKYILSKWHFFVLTGSKPYYKCSMLTLTQKNYILHTYKITL